MFKILLEPNELRKFYIRAENVSAGPGFTQSAMDSVFPGLVLTLLRLHYFLAFKRFWLITILQKQTSLI
jgi:hypothetical protein